MTAEGTAETVEGIVAAEEMEAVEPVEQQVSSGMGPVETFQLCLHVSWQLCPFC